MSDLISREELLDYLQMIPIDLGYREVDDITEYVKNMPSAQPEPSTEIQEILNYLDTTLHPIVSPDNWYVYAELHDMVSMLPSAQPKTGHWIMTHDYFTGAYESIDYVKCSCCGEDSLEEGDYCPNCGAKMVEPQESEDKE